MLCTTICWICGKIGNFILLSVRVAGVIGGGEGERGRREKMGEGGIVSGLPRSPSPSPITPVTQANPTLKIKLLLPSTAMKSLPVFFRSFNAFDTLDHEILFAKLEHYICGLALKWFRNYLSCHKQFVQFNQTCFPKQTIKCGVTQGSFLDPLFFILYINDLPNVSKLTVFTFCRCQRQYFVFPFRSEMFGISVK